jgi:hypothetical protein
VQQPGLIEAVGPGGKEANIQAQGLEMSAGLHELIFSPAWRLEGEGGCVEQHCS